MSDYTLFEEASQLPVMWTPHPYQRSGIIKMVSQAAAGLFFDPGLGKTSTTLMAFKILKDKGFVKKMLVIAPLRVCHNVWPKEVLKWANFSGLSVCVLHGPKKDALLGVDADIYCVNPDGLQWLFSEGRVGRLGVDMLVVDESTQFKNSTSKRFKLLKKELDRFKRRYILTGTPAPNGLMDLFGQIYLLDRGLCLGRFITRFRQTYFEPTGFGGYDWKLKPGAAEAIHETIRPLCMRLSAEDYLELPELVVHNISVTLPPAARRLYDQVHEDFLAEVSSTEVLTTVSAGAASIKCRQIANGAVYRDNREAYEDSADQWLHVHDEKIEALGSLIDELSGQPLLLAYEFEHDKARLKKAFPQITFASDFKASEFSEVEDRWNRGEIEVLAGHPRSMGHGLNLQGAGQHVAWFGLTWDLELYDQFNRRVLRQGNSFKHVFVHHIIADKTVEVLVGRALGRKDRTQRELLDSLRVVVGAEETF